MKMVLLCGGTGRRMFPITEDKFLLSFVGKTLLERQIELAKKAGLGEVVVVGNPQNINRIEQIAAQIPDIRVSLAIQKEPLGIANALEAASQFLSDEIIVVNTNDVFDISAYTQLLNASQDGSAISYLLAREVSDYFPGGYLVVNEDGELEHIVEKPGRGSEPSRLVNILIHLHRDPKRLLSYAKGIQTDRDDVYERAIDAMAVDRVKVIPYAGAWQAIKYPWHIHAVVRQVLAGVERSISPSAIISERAIIVGPVVIDSNARVMENAVIRGPVYIGPNTVVGNNSLVRDYSHIGADCIIGYSTEIKGSYIGDRCYFHMNYIGDSVVGDDCLFGAGTVLANFRFDERNISVKIGDELVETGLAKLGAIVGSNSKTGVNVNVMPGIKIGPNSVMGAGISLTEDLEPDTFVRAEAVHKTIKKKIGADRRRGGQTKELKCAA